MCPRASGTMSPGSEGFVQAGKGEGSEAERAGKQVQWFSPGSGSKSLKKRRG